MFLRILVVVALFGASHLGLLAAPLAAAALVLLGASLALGAGWTGGEGEIDAGTLHNPFEFFSVLRFAALLAVIMVASKWLVALFGGRGAVGAALFAGLADVDAITLSITQVKGAAITGEEAAVAIFAAAIANSVTKTAIAAYAGTLAFGLRYGAVTLAAMLVAAAVLFGQIVLGS